MIGSHGYQSDVARLKSVVVHSPNAEIFKVVTIAPSDHAAMPADYIGAAAQDEHASLVNTLAAHGVQVLQFTALLDEAISNAHANGEWSSWLTQSFGSGVHEQHDIDAITAEDLIGASDRAFYHVDAVTGHLAPLFLPQKWLFFCRDFAVSTPQGMIICNFINKERSVEPSLARLVFRNTDFFNSVPVAFDAEAEGVYLQGGDIIVKDSQTLLVGVNNMTEQKAAKRLAQRLDMRVIAVNMPPAISLSRDIYSSFTAANLLFLHLDSVFTLLDNQTFLVVPYWYEQPDEGTEILRNILMGFVPNGSKQMHVVDQMQQTGWVTVYAPRTGTKEDPKLKLVDFLQSEGLTPIYVGGSKSSHNPYKYLVEQVLPELRFQAANTFALTPGELVCYTGNQPFTLAALREHGLKVHEIETHELVRWNGGPHCMTLPINRSQE